MVPDTTPLQQAKVANTVERRMVAITADLKTKDLALGPQALRQANKASPASLIFTAPTKSAWAENPHSPQTNFACVLRFSAAVCWHSGHLRLVFCGGTDTSRPPLHFVLYANWRRNSNGRASRMARFSPDFWVTRFPGFAFLPLLEARRFLTCKSSTNTTAWFLLMSFEDLCRKSFLMLAILLCNRVTRRLAFFPLLENFFLRAMRRGNLVGLRRNFFNGCNCSMTSPLPSTHEIR